MSTQGIQLADLNHIFRTLNDINSGLSNVQGSVLNIDSKVEVTRNELVVLQNAFSDFVAADLRAKEVQLAETRQVKVRQELETKFGHYATIRRHATGILQAADLTLVRQETIAYETEELMLIAPGYWLAPALVAVAAWLRNERDLATRAIAEAARRDDEKTSLFLALIGRRARRLEVCRQWLDRFFRMQDPLQLDRQGVVLVDALASGVFGVEVRQSCSQRMAAWVQELAQRPNFVAEQRNQWTNALMSKVSAHDRSKEFKYLSKYSPTWTVLQKALNGGAVHSSIHDHFKAIFSGQITPSPSLEASVDELLTKLVSNFDDEELPLRRTDRFLEIVIDENGDRVAANAKFALEGSALEEQVSFTQLLTNAAMHPETSHASLATQRLAISVSRQWIKDAYSDVVAALRQEVPSAITLEIEGWRGTTTNGENEVELLSDLRGFLALQKEKKLINFQFGVGHWLGVFCGAALTLLGVVTPARLFAIIGVGLLIGMWISYSNIQTARQKIEEEHQTLAHSCMGILKASLSEVVEWRREYARLDATSELVVQLFQRLSPSQHIQTQHDSARQVVVTM